MATHYLVDDINGAYKRVKDHVHQTPILTSTIIDDLAGAKLYFKCENFQRAGSFKIRGATNAILQLTPEEQKRGVITHSSGNFAQALAYAARQMNIPAFIVMPENAPKVKVDAVKGYGAQIRFCKNTQKIREATMQEWQNETGASFLHPYDNRNVILGQSTCGYEILQQVETPNSIVVPVGGGGLISGTALTAHFLSPKTRVYAAEPKGADDAWHSFHHNKIFPSEKPNTIADGLLTSLGEHTFPIIQKHVKDVLLVTDEEIIEAMRLVWTRMKIIIEPSSATTLAAVLKNKSLFLNQKVVLLVSGGNVDVNKLPF
ncbi:MAG: threonine/serine dehydratase [Salinivirgaceae bacterium]